MLLSTLFLAQETAAAAAQPGILEDLHERMGLEWNLLLSQGILFLIVAFALKRFAYEPILKLLDQRQAAIKEGIENAARIKEELAAAQAKYAEIVRQANEKANALIEEARATAELQGRKALQEAALAAEAHLANARAQTEQERQRMLRDLKAEVLRLVADATGRATGKILTPEDQARLQTETVAAAASRN